MNKLRFYILFLLVAIFSFSGKAQPYSYQIALAKYNGGGDWYANLETSLPNLIKFCNDNLKTNINPEQAIVELGSKEIFNYPFEHRSEEHTSELQSRENLVCRL